MNIVKFLSDTSQNQNLDRSEWFPVIWAQEEVTPIPGSVKATLVLR